MILYVMDHIETPKDRNELFKMYQQKMKDVCIAGIASSELKSISPKQVNVNYMYTTAILWRTFSDYLERVIAITVHAIS